ncbi:MAG: CMP-N-acetlyneuraminic acid synthetase [Arcobacter sp.]|nr:MAG: CMP-N-acetlyneuraminic acid synthetase [Arcobacter sp.]
MYKNKTFLAIIPARGGSKRLSRKNVRLLQDIPLLAHTIIASKKSKYVDQTLVSSDDVEILTIAQSYNADTIKRPEILARDTSTTFDAIKHAIDNSKKYDYIILLQATSPLRIHTHIDEAIELLFEKKAKGIISVCEMEHSPLWSNTLDNNKDMSLFLSKDIINQRSQDLDTFYRLNGAIYISSLKELLEQKSFFLTKSIYAYVMKKEDSIDIDEEFDFKIAELFLSTKKIVSK